MLCAQTVSRSLVLSLALLLSGGCAKEKDAHGEGHGHPPAVYEAEVHDPASDTKTTKTFDMSKPEDAAHLNEAIQAGHVHELKVKEQLGLKKLFSLSADLGLWSLVVFLILFYVLSKLAWPKML